MPSQSILPHSPPGAVTLGQLRRDSHVLPHSPVLGIGVRREILSLGSPVRCWSEGALQGGNSFCQRGWCLPGLCSPYSLLIIIPGILARHLDHPNEHSSLSSHTLDQWFPYFHLVQNHLKGSFKTLNAGLHPQSVWFRRLGWLRTCLSSKFPGGAIAAGPGTTPSGFLSWMAQHLRKSCLNIEIPGLYWKKFRFEDVIILFSEQGTFV